MAVDEAYISWFLKRFGQLLYPNLWAIPVTGAIQGHPEAGRLWQDHIIVSFITGPELRFTTTGHEPNLYRRIFLGELFLICHQVDDFAIGTSTPAIANLLIAKINSFARTSLAFLLLLASRIAKMVLMFTRLAITSNCLVKPTSIAFYQPMAGKLPVPILPIVMIWFRSIPMLLHALHFWSVLLKALLSTTILHKKLVSAISNCLVS
jgi:hypothetical protein